MFRAAAVAGCGCEPGAVIWIWRYFGDCVYTSWELVAFLVGISSIFFWLIAQMPQFVSNILRQSADALSPWFLFQWLAGDIFNLLGCLFTGNQLATQTVTAFYFVFADCGIISQYIYYQVRNRDKKEHYPYSSDLDGALYKPTFGYTDVTLGHEYALERNIPTESTSATKNMNYLDERNEMHGTDPLDKYCSFKCSVKNYKCAIVQDENCMVATDTSHNDSTSSRDIFYLPSEREITAEQKPNIQKAPEQEIGEDSSKNEQLGIQEPPLTLQQGICERHSTDLKITDSISNLNHPSPQTNVVAGRCYHKDFEDRNHHKCRKKVLFLPLKKQLGPCNLHRHLRRVVMEYGLEYGPPSISRLNTNHILRLKKFDLKRKPDKLEKKLSFPVLNPNLKQQLGLAASMAVGLSRCHLAEGSGLLQILALKTENFAKHLIVDSGTITGRRVLKGINQMVGTSGGISREVWSSAAVLQHLLRTSDGQTLILPCSGSNHGFLWAQQIGLLFGWTSSFLYLGSRVSQLIKNSQRRSAEGLSLGMVICAVFANLTYGLAILMRTNSWQDIAGKAPWVIGSLGTVSLDVCIFMQAQYFKYHCKPEDPTNYTLLA